MISLVEQNRSQIFELCRRYHVHRLDLFGSATSQEQFDSSASDLDFLVDFLTTDAMNRADQYFGLLESLEELFGRNVDLVSARSLKNPYFVKSVNATREALYAA